MRPELFVPSTDSVQPFYTIEEAAALLKISPNHARRLFESEHGVLDLSLEPGRRWLRIPHDIFLLVLKRREVSPRRRR